MTATSTSFQTIKRDLVLAADPRSIRTFQDKPTPRYVPPRPRLRPPGQPQPRSSAIALVESATSRHKVPHPFQRTIATTDGEIIWAVRYPRERQSRSIFYTTDVPTLRKLYPARPELPESQTTPGSSSPSPSATSPGVGDEMPESPWGIVAPGREEVQPFPTQNAVDIAACRLKRRRRTVSCPWPRVRAFHATDLAAGSVRLLSANRSAVGCHPLRWASITRVNSARGRSHSGRRV